MSLAHCQPRAQVSLEMSTFLRGLRPRPPVPPPPRVPVTPPPEPEAVEPIEFSGWENRLRTIMRAVCRVSGLTAREIGSESRERRSTQARQVFFYLARTRTTRSLSLIGAYLDDARDHTSVLCGLRRVEKVMADNRLTITEDMGLEDAARALLSARWFYGSNRKP